MNFTPRRKTAALEKHEKSSCNHDLQLYREVPDFNINLDEFEEWAMERLKVLQIMEQLSLKGNSSSFEEFTKTVVNEIKKEGLKHMYKLVMGRYNDYEENCEARKRDVCSHFILRLTYCKNDELRKWFISREIDLFKLRWSLLSRNDKLEFLSSNNTSYTAVSEEEHKLMTENMSSFTTAGGNNEYFKVCWTQVLKLVSQRKVFLCDGFAFVLQTDVISGICQMFRSELSLELTKCFQKFNVICDDKRFGAFIKYLHQSYMGKNYSVLENMSTLSINTIDQASKDMFPLCMKRLHATLRSEHHLKHQARQQYGLFLKGAGLPLDQAVVFWKSEFTKKIDADKFDKQYSYNIRHNYGKEGKKTNYTPYSCMKIIMSAVGIDEFHGCPYKHANSQALKQLLETSNISPQSVQEILTFSQNGHYQIACTKYFEVKYGQSPSSTAINHPNQFYEESQKLKGYHNDESNHNKSQVNSSMVDSIHSTDFDQSITGFVDKMDCD